MNQRADLEKAKVDVWVALRLTAIFSAFHFCISLPKPQTWKMRQKSCEAHWLCRPVSWHRIKSHGRHGAPRQLQVLGNVTRERLLKFPSLRPSQRAPSLKPSSNPCLHSRLDYRLTPPSPANNHSLKRVYMIFVDAPPIVMSFDWQLSDAPCDAAAKIVTVLECVVTYQSYQSTGRFCKKLKLVSG